MAVLRTHCPRHSAYTYSKACKLFGIQQNPQIIRDLVLSYEAEGCLINVNMFREVLKLCKEAQLADVALWVLRKMEQSFNIGADTVMYNVVIRLCCKNDDIETVEKLIGEMSLNGLYPDLITYMAIVEGLCDVGRPEHAYSLLKGRVVEAYKLIDKFVVEHGVSYGDCCSSLVISLIRIKKLDEAMKLFMEMLSGDARPDTLASSLLLKELCMKDRVLDGFYLLEAIENKGCLSAIDSDIYSILLFGLCQRSHLTEATKLAKIMLKKSVPLQSPYKEGAIDVLIESGEKDLVNHLTGIRAGL
ncbi:Pentatricopeptide repeat-containing protein [Vigna angularis]|uniref:Pentatricopeptide repeat-containing protein n=1 Tax=Phaseolus angularis TaxID=3914 RepID=A0A8T0JTT6_PHAAN|nr:Pentatricopeptide repeat-containing protein [Vigna angularis]